LDWLLTRFSLLPIRALGPHCERILVVLRHYVPKRRAENKAEKAQVTKQTKHAREEKFEQN